MDAIQMLIQDHKEAEELFLLFEGSDDEAVKEAVVHKLCMALKVHMAIEEEIFYPEARGLFDDEDDELVEEAEKEHSMAKKIIDALEKREAGFRMDVQVKALKMAIEHHVEEEETQMFPKLQKLGMETSDLGNRMAERKHELKSAA